MASEAFVAIGKDGIMYCAAVITPDGRHESAVADWQRDETIQQIIRVPVEIPRAFLFEQWPGIEQATAWVAALPAS